MPVEPQRQDFNTEAAYMEALDTYIWLDEEQGEKELDEFFKQKKEE